MKKFHIFLLLVAMFALAGCAADVIYVTADEIINSTSGDNTLKDPALAWSDSYCEATLGAENTFPTLTNQYEVDVTYTSSDAGVAAISADGTVTLVAAGTTTITAKHAEDDTYDESSAYYSLTVVKSADVISWSADECTVTLGADDNSYPQLNNPGGQEVTYTSGNTTIATIDSYGIVTPLAEGTTTIIATSKETDIYDGLSVHYTLKIRAEGSTLEDPGLSWSTSYATVTLGTEPDLPTLANPYGLEVTYSSSNTSVATVDGSGNVTLVGKGTTAITASSAATSAYSASSVSYTLKVVKNTISISWSESSFTALLEESNTYPTLSVSPSGLSIIYSSSDTGVATISDNGNVTAIAAGKTTISATFEGNDYYEAASATYSLTVSASADDGAVDTTFPSSGDTSSDDDISNTAFTRLVTVTYSSSGATVSGYSAVSDLMTVTTSGNKVEITYTGTENVVYKLTGTASDGCFKLYSSKKQAIWLSGVSITNSSGAAINNQSGKRTFVYVEGTNKLADGSSAAYSTTGDEDMKGVFFSEGQLIFSGSGSLTVTANNAQSKSGIVSDDYVRFMSSPTVTVTCGSSAGHGVKANEYVRINNGMLAVTTKAAMKKGITSDDYVLVEGGTSNITVSGGVAYDSEDAEYTGTAGIKADNYFGMTGGTVTIVNTGTGGKGIRAGSYDYYSSNSKKLTDSYISGGSLSITTSGSESNDVSSKGLKIGFKQKSGSSYIYAGNLVVNGGATVISCSRSESVEIKGTLTFNGGEFYVSSTGDDAINSQGQMTINGGYIYGYSTQNDAIDTNCDMVINGGYVYAVTTKGAPEVALDANTEGGYKLYIYSGATVVAYGGLESGYSSANTVYTLSGTAGAWNALYSGSSYIAAFKAPSGLSSFAVTAPSLSSGYKGVTVSGGSQLCNGMWASSGISGGTSVTLSAYGGGSGGGGGGFGPGGGGGRH